jgi:hypothetical protein
MFSDLDVSFKFQLFVVLFCLLLENESLGELGVFYFLFLFFFYFSDFSIINRKSSFEDLH